MGNFLAASAMEYIGQDNVPARYVSNSELVLGYYM